MDVDYNHPGTMRISLEHDDLVRLQQNGFTVERDGFSGMESKTWVHLPPIEESMISHVHEASAEIEPGGDLHVRLSRGFPTPIEIGQDAIAAPPGFVEHYLGSTGIILVLMKEQI